MVAVLDVRNVGIILHRVVDVLKHVVLQVTMTVMADAHHAIQIAVVVLEVRIPIAYSVKMDFF
jgi:hypothetical protein